MSVFEPRTVTIALTNETTGCIHFYDVSYEMMNLLKELPEDIVSDFMPRPNTGSAGYEGASYAVGLVNLARAYGVDEHDIRIMERSIPSFFFVTGWDDGTSHDRDTSLSRAAAEADDLERIVSDIRRGATLNQSDLKRLIGLATLTDVLCESDGTSRRIVRIVAACGACFAIAPTWGTADDGCGWTVWEQPYEVHKSGLRHNGGMDHWQPVD